MIANRRRRRMGAISANSTATAPLSLLPRRHLIIHRLFPLQLEERSESRRDLGAEDQSSSDDGRSDCGDQQDVLDGHGASLRICEKGFTQAE
jgi:hypothetical protein